MFGLMKFHGCSASKELRERHRLHYCGTCKTIGSMFGQKSRFALNNDTVFLAELLTAIQGQTEENWVKPLHSRNCFALPETATDAPLALQAAASANLLLAEFKVRDSLSDEPSSAWRAANKLFAAEFASATVQMSRFGAPVERLWEQFDEQLARENSKPPLLPTRELLLYYAEPTACVTAEVFRSCTQGTSPNKTIAGSQMERLGKMFGNLVYLIDAIEDEESDERRKQFNPLIIARSDPEASENDLELIDEEITTTVRWVVNSALAELNTLDIDSALRDSFKLRLADNVRQRLGSKYVPSQARCRTKNHAACQTTVDTLAETSCSLWDSASERARSIARQTAPDAALPVRILLQPLAFIWVLFVSLCAPIQSESFTDISEFLELSLNLIFWGSAGSTMVRAVTTAPAMSFLRAKSGMSKAPRRTSGRHSIAGARESQSFPHLETPAQPPERKPDTDAPHKPPEKPHQEPGEPETPDLVPPQDEPERRLQPDSEPSPEDSPDHDARRRLKERRRSSFQRGDANSRSRTLLQTCCLVESCDYCLGCGATDEMCGLDCCGGYGNYRRRHFCSDFCSAICNDCDICDCCDSCCSADCNCFNCCDSGCNCCECCGNTNACACEHCCSAGSCDCCAGADCCSSADCCSGCCDSAGSADCCSGCSCH